MIFYHFTSVPLAESIIHSGISEGHLSRSDGTILKPIVWLTTDSSVNGHGLPTGGTIPESKRRYAMAVQGDLKDNLLQDKTQVRLRVRQLRSDKNLISFKDWCRRYERAGYARFMGLSAVCELENASGEQIAEWMRTVKTKEDTWWLYPGTIQPTAIEAVDFNVSGGFETYVFEQHGRSQFREAGFSTVSKAALDDLRVILPPTHKFDQAKAFCFFAAPSAARHYQGRRPLFGTSSPGRHAASHLRGQPGPRYAAEARGAFRLDRATPGRTECVLARRDPDLSKLLS